MRQASKGGVQQRFVEGAIYNPRDGRPYRVSIKLKNPNALELSGCLLAVLCQTQPWTRVTEGPAKPPPASGRS